MNKYNDYSNIKSNFSSNTNFFESKLNFQNNNKNQANEESINGENDDSNYKINVNKKKNQHIDPNIDINEISSNRKYQNNGVNDDGSNNSNSNRINKEVSDEENIRVFYDSNGTMNFSSNRNQNLQASSDRFRTAQKNFSENASNFNSSEFKIEEFNNKLGKTNITSIKQSIKDQQSHVNINDGLDNLKNSQNNVHLDTDENMRSNISSKYSDNILPRKQSKNSSSNFRDTRQSKNYIKSNFSSKKNTKNTVDILTDRSEYNIPSKEISNKSRKSLALIQKQNQDLIDKLSKISKEKQTLENQIKLRANKKPYYRIIKQTEPEKLEELKKYEQDILTDFDNKEFIPNSLPYNTDPLGDLIDGIIRNSMMKYKNKHCKICSNLLTKGKTSKACESYHHKI